MGKLTDLFMGRTPEVRESSYTDTLVGLIVSQAGGQVVKATATAAVQTCAGLYARAFASAEIDGPSPIVEAFHPGLRAMAGRALIRQGEIVFVVDVRNGRMVLLPAADHDISGGHDPATWQYRVTLSGPSSTISREVPADRVLHFKFETDPDRPWRGISPIESAALAGRLSAETTSALADEASMTTGSLLPIPTDGQDPTVSALRADLKNLRGDIALVESTSTGQWPTDGRTGGGEWTPRRLGANPPQSLVQLAELACREILTTTGVSPALFDPSAATAARESWRQALFGAFWPLGQMMAAELESKLGEAVSFSWSELRASDLQGRARAYGSLVEAGYDPAAAARLAGLEVT
ncbi:MAG: phage portal protein [bacterium]|nr:phage portal protein [bacterium]